MAIKFIAFYHVDDWTCQGNVRMCRYYRYCYDRIIMNIYSMIVQQVYDNLFYVN